jgi:hypothetical protein
MFGFATSPKFIKRGFIILKFIRKSIDDSTFFLREISNGFSREWIPDGLDADSSLPPRRTNNTNKIANIMKPNIKQITLFAVASSALVTASAAVPVPIQGSEQTLTIQLATHKTVDGTYVKDEDGKTVSPKESTDENDWSKGDVDYYEYVTKIETQKYGNKQILEELDEAGVIDGIAGWSIKLIERVGLEDSDSELFLVKKDTPPIPIGEYLTLNDFASAWAANYKETTDNSKETVTIKGSENWIDSVIVELDPDDSDYPSFQLTGLATGSATVKKIDGIYAWYHNSESIKVVGASQFPEDESEEGRPTEGTMKLSAAKPIEDVSAYFPPVMD